MKKQRLQKIFIFILLVISLVALFFFFKDTILILLKYEKENNEEAINTFLRDKGILGMLMLVVLQALDMVVVFISAELVQIPAGICYPWYISVFLLDLGVFIGATLIFLLVRLLKFDSRIFKNTSNKIDDMVKRDKKNRGFQSLMYILFIMPIIPFGAICYYGASTKMSYRRYITTCITGVLPSIFMSIITSNIITEFISRDIPLYILVIIALAFMIVLFTILTIVINKLYFVDGKGTPNSIFYIILFKVIGFVVKMKAKLTFDRKNLDEINDPYIILTNHQSFFDFYYIGNLVQPSRISFIANRYYFNNKFLSIFFKQVGVIPKKLFSPDIETIKSTFKTINKGFSIFMCPEGRLSIDGTNYPITKETGKLLKKLNVPVVITNIHGAYLANAKWRKNRIRGNIHTEVKYIIKKEELDTLSIDEINRIINDNLQNNDFEYARKHNFVYKNNNKLRGLENVIYVCPNCKNEYTLLTKKSICKCNHCGFELKAKENYSFEDNELHILDLPDLYKRQVDYEKDKLQNHNINLSCKGDVVKYNLNNKKCNQKGHGICKLNNDYFIFEGYLNNSKKSFMIPIKQLKALPFSCGKEFECYYEEELYYFYPVENCKQCVKWSLLVDLLNREDK